MMIRYLIMTVLVISSAGCVGISIDHTVSESVHSPVPLTVPKILFSDHQERDRWACEAAYGTKEPLTKKEFISAWGEPREKQLTSKGEIWIYSETDRWCGLFVYVIVPIPLILPVCETYDKVYFENGVAVSSESHRFVGYAFYLSPPGPAFARPGRVNERDKLVAIGEGGYDNACSKAYIKHLQPKK